MSKKMKFLIGLILALVVIGLFFGITTTYRFFKLQTIWKKVNENVRKENFNMETTIINNGKIVNTKTYYKDGIGKFISHDGTYIWFNGIDAYSVDETNKIAINLTNIEETAVPYKESFASLYPGYSYNFFEKLMFAGNLSNKIKNDYYNGQKVTYIEINEEEYTKTYWITKEFSNLVKAEIKFSNGDVYEYKYDIKFHTTKLKDVELPDFSDYTMQNEENKYGNKEENVTDNKEALTNTTVENTITQVK